jgi:hypothetical protein
MSELDYTVKTCTRCKQEKHITDFARLVRKKEARRAMCQECSNLSVREWYSSPEGKEKLKAKQRRNSLRMMYGISLEQYDQLLAEQDHRCALCKKHEDEFKINLAVDHDHISGRIRGLLCGYCNRRVLGRHRDGELLRRMADYVEQGTDWYVPAKKPKKKKKKAIE